MPIHTVATDKKEYIRVIGSFDGNVNRHLGKVGKVNAYSDDNAHDLIFADIDNEPMVFLLRDTEFITKKEYFKGCLGG